MPKKSNHLRASLHETPSSAPPYVHTGSLETTMSTHRHLSKLTPKFNISKRSSSRKRRWETLVEAAKSGKVGKLINKSRSEDSVCNSKTGRHSNSPGSDENQTESDSNPSLVEALGSGLSSLQSGLSNFGLGSGALAALKKKRKKFSTSRTKPCIKSEDKTPDSSNVPGVYSLSDEWKSEKLLKRASSVPTRNPDVIHTVKFVHFSEEEGEAMSPAGNEEYKTTLPGNLEPKPNQSKNSNISDSGTSQDHQDISQNSKSSSGLEPNLPFKSRNGSATLPNLPGVQPVSGSQGWL